jgi:hypothetical protein
MYGGKNFFILFGKGQHSTLLPKSTGWSIQDTLGTMCIGIGLKSQGALGESQGISFRFHTIWVRILAPSLASGPPNILETWFPPLQNRNDKFSPT